MSRSTSGLRRAISNRGSPPRATRSPVLAAPIADLNGKYAALGRGARGSAHARPAGDARRRRCGLRRLASRGAGGDLRPDPRRAGRVAGKADGLCRRRAQSPPERSRRNCRPRARRSSNPMRWSSICSGANASWPRARSPRGNGSTIRSRSWSATSSDSSHKSRGRVARRTIAKLSAVRRDRRRGVQRASFAGLLSERNPGATRSARRWRPSCSTFSKRATERFCNGSPARRPRRRRP